MPDFIVPVIFLLAMGGFIAFMVVAMRGAQQYKQRRQLELTACFTEAGAESLGEGRFRYRGLPLDIEFTDDEGSAAVCFVVRFPAPLAGTFSIVGNRAMGALTSGAANLLAGRRAQQVRTGDPALDRRFYIASNPPQLADRVLSPELKRLLGYIETIISVDAFDATLRVHPNYQGDDRQISANDWKLYLDITYETARGLLAR